MKSDGAPDGTSFSQIPSISSDSDGQIKHSLLPSSPLKYESLTFRGGDGAKKWGESIVHWSIKREKPIAPENGGKLNAEKEFVLPSLSNSGSFALAVFPSTSVPSEVFPKKTVAPLSVTQEEVVSDIIKISELNYGSKPSNKGFIGFLILVLLFIFCSMIYKRFFNKKFKEDENPFLEIKKRIKAAAKSKKPLKSK